MLHKYLAIALVLLMLPSCAISRRLAGVENRWRASAVLDFQTGKTTASEVLEKLGPPSQLIAMGDRTAYYYLLEAAKTDSLILIVYNASWTKVSYDRAVFFFDTNGVLEAQSISFERVPYVRDES